MSGCVCKTCKTTHKRACVVPPQPRPPLPATLQMRHLRRVTDYKPTLAYASASTLQLPTNELVQYCAAQPRPPPRAIIPMRYHSPATDHKPTPILCICICICINTKTRDSSISSEMNLTTTCESMETIKNQGYWTKIQEYQTTPHQTPSPRHVSKATSARHM